LVATERLQGFWVGDWWVQPATSELVRAGRVVPLEPKVMALLEYLATQPGGVISREELEASIWQGTVVGYDALAKAMNKLREALGDDKSHPAYIQTISKKGYRLIAPVRMDAPAGENQDAGKLGKPINMQWLVGTVLIAATLALAVISLQQPGKKKDLTTSFVANNKPVIVVMPFRNIGADPADNYLAEGLTSDLNTDLSKLSSLEVVALNSVLENNKATLTQDKVKKDLHVRYVLSGDVNKSGSAIRINVLLTDIVKGSILWANRYDRKFTDLFAIQDEVTQKIVQSMSLTLTQEEQRRIARRYTGNLQAYEYFLRGQSLLSVRTPEDNTNAREMYKKAIELDPGFGRAYAGLAMTYAIGFNRQWPTDVDKPLEKALELSNYAINLDKDLPASYWVAGYVNSNQRRTDQAIELLNHALRLNPNYADAYTVLGWVYISIGEPEKALEYLARAKRLNPAGGFLYDLQFGKANYFMGNSELALNYLIKAQEKNPAFIDTLYYLAATYISLERFDEASWVMGEARIINPAQDTQTWLNNSALRDKKFIAKLGMDLLKAEKYKPE